jgi:predicted nucleic acid-binding protein
MTTYFFDTYAIIELIKGNPLYERYKNAEKITTMLNLLELYYSLLKDFNENIADYYFDNFLNFVVPYSAMSVKDAAKFKLKTKGKEFSYIDCLGYIISLENSVKFLTGDEGFKGLENVEFVK